MVFMQNDGNFVDVILLCLELGIYVTLDGTGTSCTVGPRVGVGHNRWPGKGDSCV